MTISILSSVPYSFLRQRPHQLAHEFLRAGMTVTFIDPPGNRLRTLLHRTGGSATQARHAGLRHLSLQSLRVPLLDVPIWPTNATVGACRRTLRHQLYSRPPGRPHALILADPLHQELVPEGAVDLLCYDCVDDPSLFVAAHGSNFYEHRDRLVRKSALVFATAERLEEDLRRTYPEATVVQVPNGVDAEWFQQQASVVDRTLPDDGRPIVGYVGALYEWLDADLVLDVARRLPEVRFALVGPLRGLRRESALRSTPNITLVGPVAYERVPGLMARLAIGMIPFTPGTLADSTDPIKLYEYFALGKPVVATSMHQLLRFQDGDLLRCSSGAEDFARNIRSYLEADAPEQRRARQTVAKEHSWRRSAQRIIQALEGASSR